MILLNIKRKLSGANGLLNLDFNTSIDNGELVTLYGPTGSGKSSVLSMLAGLMKPDSGNIMVDDETWFDHSKRINIVPQKRNIGMVFQDYSLFPNMTIRENLEYALSNGQDSKTIDDLLEVSGLENLQHKKPFILSGGQKQRVALTRALVRKPKLLLLDEPLSALDSEMRSKLQDYILRFHQEFHLTTILVSHDLPEVIKMSQRILILENGSIKHDCAPQILLEQRF